MTTLIAADMAEHDPERLNPEAQRREAWVRRQERATEKPSADYLMRRWRELMDKLEGKP